MKENFTSNAGIQSSLTEGVPYSHTVQSAHAALENKPTVSSVEIIKTILNSHTEYADSTPANLENHHSSRQEHISDWLAHIEKLFDLEPSKQLLGGRLVILGLAILESGLRKTLETNGFLPKLITEITSEVSANILNLLSPEGKELWQYEDQLDRPQNYADEPKASPSEDLLGREAYGAALSKILQDIPEKNSYAMHVHGPWGSGKSTLLNFITAKLDSDKWLVVDFNAWRHQHIDPPWWSLLDAIFQKAAEKKGKTNKRSISRKTFLKEYIWRLTMGEKLKPVIIILLIACIGYALYQSSDSSLTELSFWKNTLEYISKIFIAIAAIWVALQTVTKSFFFHSARAAESYLTTTTEPMVSLKEHFNRLVEEVGDHNKSGKRILVVIDDLDRCNEQYVVDLLEGFQIIFREAGIIMVVAADRDWLNACFSHVYKNMEQQIQVPGKSLGCLFTEKIFQLNAAIPDIPEEIKANFWQQLLDGSGAEKNNEEYTAAYEQAKAKLKDLNTVSAVQQESAHSKNLSFIERQAMKQASISRLSDKDMTSEQEHRLKLFTPFLDSNPRNMLRLVNTYHVNQTLSILLELKIPFKKLALWTILAMRWPQLANHLSLYPEDVQFIGKEKSNTPDRIDESIQILLNDEQVISVVTGRIKTPEINMNAHIEEETIRACKFLRN